MTNFVPTKMDPQRLAQVKRMLDAGMTVREMRRHGIHSNTLIRAKRALGIPTKRDAERAKLEKAAAASLLQPPGVPANELSIDRCVWLVSQNPRLFCGKEVEPQCRPYCVKCNSLAMRQRRQAMLTGGTTKSARRSD